MIVTNTMKYAYPMWAKAHVEGGSLRDSTEPGYFNVPAGGSLDVPDEVWDRYKNRKDVQALLEKGLLMTGDTARRAVDSGIIVPNRVQVNLAALTKLSQEELLEKAIELDVEVGADAPPQEIIEAIADKVTAG